MKISKRIVITGVGTISSLGKSLNNVWINACEKKIGLKKERFRLDGGEFRSFFVHKVRSDLLENRTVDVSRLSILSRDHDVYLKGDLNLFLLLVKDAIEDGELQYDLDCNNIGLVMTAESPLHGQFYKRVLSFIHHEFNNMKRDYTKNRQVQNSFFSFFNEFKNLGYDLQTFMNLFYVGKFFSLHGYSLWINNACASGLYALEVAADAIRTNKCSKVIIAAVDTPDIFKLMWFEDKKLNSIDGKIRPFCKEANGFVLGEGGAALVLEDYAVAKRRKAKIYAEYVGSSFSMDSWKITYPAVHKKYYKETMLAAMHTAEIKPSEIDIVVPHGIGNPMVDKFEANTIASVFSRYRKRPIVTAFKPYVGHNLGGCTLLEVVMLLLCMKKNIILPILNSTTFCRNDLEFATGLVKRPIKTALKTCTAFAGFNAAAIFRNLE